MGRKDGTATQRHDQRYKDEKDVVAHEIQAKMMNPVEQFTGFSIPMVLHGSIDQCIIAIGERE